MCPRGTDTVYGIRRNGHGENQVENGAPAGDLLRRACPLRTSYCSKEDGEEC